MPLLSYLSQHRRTPWLTVQVAPCDTRLWLLRGYIIHKKAVNQVHMKLILRSFYVQTTGTIKLFGFQSLPPVHVINKEVCFSSLFLTDSSINVCHATREAKVAVDVRGKSFQYTMLTNSPHSIACQSRAMDESLCLHFQRSFTG